MRAWDIACEKSDALFHSRPFGYTIARRSKKMERFEGLKIVGVPGTRFAATVGNTT